jgi:CheY-like chemotaxis protein
MGSFFDSIPVNGFLSKPCAVDALLAKIREILSQTRGQPAVAEGRSLPGENIVLLAEDDPDIARNIASHLVTLGCRTVTVCSGPEVIEAAVRVRPRLVILKQLLPKMNGSVLAPVLAGMPMLRRTPILLYDGSRRYDDPGIFESRLPSAITRYVPSNSASDLLHAVERILVDAAGAKA